MTARGISVNDANASYAEYTFGAAITAALTDFSMCGWMNINGNNGSNRGQVPFSLFSGGVQTGELYFMDGTFSGASPWTITGQSTDTIITNTTGSWSPATGENWFYAFWWDHTALKATFFAGKDGATSLTSATDALQNTMTSFNTLRFASQFFGSYSNNVTTTCGRAWSGSGIPTTAANFLVEMKSPTPVNITGIYGAWPIMSSSDTSDTSGNSRTLTMVGTVSNGIMDPVDIRTSTGLGCVFRGLSITH